MKSLFIKTAGLTPFLSEGLYRDLVGEVPSRDRVITTLGIKQLFEVLLSGLTLNIREQRYVSLVVGISHSDSTRDF